MDLHRHRVTIRVVSVCPQGHIHPEPDTHVDVLELATDTRGVQVLTPFPPVQLLPARHQPTAN